MAREATFLAACLVFMLMPARAADPPRLLVLGDSLAAGYGLARPDGFEAQLVAALGAHGHAVRLVDAAVSGDTSAGGRARLDWVLDDGADAADAVGVLSAEGSPNPITAIPPASSATAAT